MAAPAPLTLQHIADLAKVSRTTVSLALRNHPKITPEVRQRVQALAKKLDYRPNPLVSAHMAHLRALHPAQTGQCLAFACRHSLEEIETDTKSPLWRYYCGARDRARDLGYQLEFFNIHGPDMTVRRTSQILRARGICGVIITPLSEGPGVSDIALEWNEFAMATIEHVFLQPQLHKACNDGFSTIGRAIQRLLDDGCHRVGIAMHGQMDDHANHLWLAGYTAFQALAPARDRMPHFITPRWDKEGFLRWFRRWRPEAIITINDDIVRWLRSEKIRVPQDVSCVTLYWRESRAYLSGFYQNHEVMAAGAVDLVAAQLNRNERGLPERTKTMLFQADWRDGSTHRVRKSESTDAPLRVWTA